MRLEDAPAIQAHLAGHSVALVGAHQFSPEGVANFLRDPALELTTDTWLVTSGKAISPGDPADTANSLNPGDPADASNSGGQVVGSAAAVRGPGRSNLEVCSADREVTAWLLDRAIGRAVEQARSEGRTEQRVRLGMLRADRQLAEVAAERGLTIETSVERMKIEFAGPVEPPAVPAGVTVHRGAFDETIRRAGHRVIAESFATQPDAIPRPYDEWVELRESRSTYDWSGMTVLELAGRPVAVREWDRNFVSSDNCGYIGRIGVLAEARGGGLAKYLLKDQFAIDAAAGLSGTLLHVDTSNPTPAVGLYLAVGMCPDIVNDVRSTTLHT